MTDGALTDVGNADRYVREHGEALRFVGSWMKWLTWDGKRWVVDETLSAVHLAKETARRMLEEAAGDVELVMAAVGRAAGDEELAKLQAERARGPKKVLEWALRSHESARIEAMVKLARSTPLLAVTHEQLDADPWLFNVSNGTIDLRTGKLRPHRREDLITKLAPVAFDEAARCPTWESFLSHAQHDDPEMLAFIRRHAGYCLTGAIRDHGLLFLFGPAGTGKSTYFRVLHDLLGDYARRAPRSLLFASRGERHPTELATLFGVRFASCSEIDEGATFDEALVKDLTGGEAIAARRMREDFWTFAPTHKLAIGGNHKPRVRNFDDAIRRRLRLVPFTAKPAHVDTELFEKLHAELPGILAWAVRGAVEWQRHGLGEPIVVQEATDEYQSEADPLREFFDLHLVFEAEARTPRVQIRQAYEEYCKENGAAPIGANRFADALRRRGTESVNVRVGAATKNGWRGVRLATDVERERCGYHAGTRSPIISSTRAHAHEDGNRQAGTHEVPTYPQPESGHAFSDLVDEVAS